MSWIWFLKIPVIQYLNSHDVYQKCRRARHESEVFFFTCGWIWGFLKTIYEESNVRGFAQDHLNVCRWMLFCHASLKKNARQESVGWPHFFFFFSLFILLYLCQNFPCAFWKKKIWSFFPSDCFNCPRPPALHCLLMTSQLYILWISSSLVFLSLMDFLRCVKLHSLLNTVPGTEQYFKEWLSVTTF